MGQAGSVLVTRTQVIKDHQALEETPQTLSTTLTKLGLPCKEDILSAQDSCCEGGVCSH